MACVCTVKLHVIVMCAPIRVTVATNVDAEGDDLDMEGGGHSLAHIIGAFHGPKRRPNPGHGSATGPSTAHKPHGQPPLPNCGQGMAGSGPRRRKEAGFGPVPGKFLGRVGQRS